VIKNKTLLGTFPRNMQYRGCAGPKPGIIRKLRYIIANKGVVNEN
jgi:hypothetical protein